MFFQNGRRWIFALMVALGAAAAAQQPGLNPSLPLEHVENGPNSPAVQRAHYLVLVSLDGFRWDYARRYGAHHLLAIGKHGASAPEGMLPSFPSLTFPNHLSIITGLYPEHHGIVANNFWDEEKRVGYSSSDPQAVKDGSWYSGVPLWSLAESQGMRTACLLWPGSEAEIAGHRPTWYAHFDAKTESEEAVEKARIDDAVALLALPPEQRPHLIAMYYSEPDHEGHLFGPEAAQTAAAVRKMDGIVGRLEAALHATGLPIDLVIVSDHGMARVEGEWITLDKFADLRGFEAVGPLLYAKTEADRVRAYNQLKHASSQFEVYRLKNVPAILNDSQNPRAGDPVIIATGPYAIRAHAPTADKPDRSPNPGAHGYDPRTMPQMKASFFAAGPDISPGSVVKPFENVNLYPWMAHILGLAFPKSDGNLNILAGTLRDNGGATPEPADQNRTERQTP